MGLNRPQAAIMGSYYGAIAKKEHQRKKGSQKIRLAESRWGRSNRILYVAGPTREYILGENSSI